MYFLLDIMLFRADISWFEEPEFTTFHSWPFLYYRIVLINRIHIELEHKERMLFEGIIIA